MPLGMFIAFFDPAFVAGRGLAAPAELLTWTSFVVRNLVPVTLGNVTGGTLLVAGVYWLVYLHPAKRRPA